MQRVPEIDFLKGVLILLMISFHLVYFEHLYPYAKQVVYTFHMPGFLILSGYLMKVTKPWRQFLRTVFFFALPYIIMESGYIVMASLLPINEHIDNLTAGVFLDKLLLHPLGPYWYLHTLVVCACCYYAVIRYVRMKLLSQLIILGLLYYLFASVLGIMDFACSLYFLAGAAIHQSGLPLLRLFQSSTVSVLALALLVIHPENLSKSTSGGIMIVYLTFSLCLFAYLYLPTAVRRPLQYLGEHTLILFLFSPMFTILCKQLVPWLSFDPTGLLFLALSLLCCVTGSLAIAWLSDTLRLSPWLFGKQKIL